MTSRKRQTAGPAKVADTVEDNRGRPEVILEFLFDRGFFHICVRNIDRLKPGENENQTVLISGVADWLGESAGEIAKWTSSHTNKQGQRAVAEVEIPIFVDIADTSKSTSHHA